MKLSSTVSRFPLGLFRRPDRQILRRLCGLVLICSPFFFILTNVNRSRIISLERKRSAIEVHKLTLNITEEKRKASIKTLTSTERCPGLNMTLPSTRQKHFQTVGVDNSTHIYAAYRDGQEIRMIAVVTKTHVHKAHFYCHLWFEAKSLDPLYVAIAKVEIMPDDHDRKKTAAFFTCKIPRDRNYMMPVAVGLALKSSCHMSHSEALPVRGPGVVLTRNFTVCVSPLNRNYNVTNQLIEMIEFNRLLGADQLVFYNHNSSLAVQKVLNYYEKRGLVQVNFWNLPTEEIHYFGQMAAINDCLYQNRNRSRFVVNEDLDEFIIPMGNSTSWTDLVKHQKRLNPDAGIFLFRNVFFRREWPFPLEEFSANEKVQKYESVVLKTTVRELYVWPHKERSKYIVDPLKTVCAGIHFAWKLKGRYATQVLVSSDDALVYHFRDWHHPVDNVSRVRDVSLIRRYGEKLVARLDTAWDSLLNSNLSLDFKTEGE